MHLRTDLGQLQRLYDAIAITMDAIRRIAVTSGDIGARANAAGNWIPAPPAETGAQPSAPRFEHSAWQQQPSWPASPIPQNPAPWLEWPRGISHAGWTGWTGPGWSGPSWSGPSWPGPGWVAPPWWGPGSRF